VARGDLGVEMPREDVPAIQKQIIAAGRKSGKPVVVATECVPKTKRLHHFPTGKHFG